MQRRYEATLMMPGRRTLGWDHALTRRFRTVRAAELWAERVLSRHPTTCTLYNRHHAARFPWSVRVADLKKNRDGRILACPYIDAPEHIVPSVGELGYW